MKTQPLAAFAIPVLLFCVLQTRHNNRQASLIDSLLQRVEQLERPVSDLMKAKEVTP